MPELPEVETVRNTLKNILIGKKIVSVDAGYEKIIKEMNLNQFNDLLKNQTFKDIRRRGKFLIFILDDFALITHLRMEGKFFIKHIDDDIEKHEHVIFNLDNDETLRYHDTRKFGTMHIRRLGDELKTIPVNKLGYEPFDDEMTVDYLKEKLENRKINVKSFLLDQTIISGLGNIYVDEICFLSKLDPRKNVSKLTDIDLDNIIKNSIKVLNKAIELGGTTIRSYTSSLGVTGRFQNELLVHQRAGEKCLECGSEIIKIKVSGRGTYYCEVCQESK